jgi:hypothetical protein
VWRYKSSEGARPFQRIVAGLVGTAVAAQGMRLAFGKPALVQKYVSWPARIGVWTLGLALTGAAFAHAWVAVDEKKK